MNVWLAAGTLAVARMACSPLPPDGFDGGTQDSQVDYQFEGCASEQYGCPNDLTLHCALRTIAEAHGVCTEDADCVVAVIDPKCAGAGVCPPFSVNSQEADAATGELQAEIDTYCADAGCSMAGDCAYSTFTARCVDGLCRAEGP